MRSALGSSLRSHSRWRHVANSCLCRWSASRLIFYSRDREYREEPVSKSFKHVKEMGNCVTVPMPRDEDGFLGRECPVTDCEGYFLLKPGTGLTGENLPCYCPYCGHKGSNQTFWTKEQLEYAKSIVLRDLVDAVRQDLKQFEFNYPARGPFGVGISMTLLPGTPVPIRHYREKALETYVTCPSCTLEYAVYGIFAYCPDCGTHNSLQMLEKNLELTAKQLALAEGLADSDLRRHLLEDALENCVSALDGFGREACCRRASRSSAPEKCENISFQNLARAAERLARLFSIDLRAAVAPDVWETAVRGFMKRHVIAHHAGVVDQQYIDETQDSSAFVGRRVPLDASEIRSVAGAVQRLAAVLLQLLPAI